MSNNNSNTKSTEKVSFLSIVASLIAIISFVFPGFSIYWLIVAIREAHNMASIIWGIVLSVLLILYICVIVNKDKIAIVVLTWIINLTAPKQSYKVIYKACKYEYVSQTELRYEKRIKPKPLRNIDGIHDQFNWTGNTALIPKPLYSDTQYVELKDRKFGMQRYDIKFNNNRNYSKKEDVPELGMVIENINDPKFEASTHLSSGVYEITEELTLKVVFDPNLKPHNFRKLTYLHYTDREHYCCDTNVEIRFDANTNKIFVEWIIKKPIFGAKYLIDWDM